MDKILWQTLGAFDHVRSFYKCIPAILLCGKHSTTMQTWIVSTLWFCWRPWGLEINFRRVLCFGSHTFVPISWVCKKQTSVSHSFTEAEIISLDAGSRMDGIPTLSGIWWLKYIIPYRTEQMDPRESHGETRRRLSSQTCITRSQSSTPTSFQQTLITFHQIQRILVFVLCGTRLKTMRPWSKWLSKVEVPQWGMFHGPTELLWIGKELCPSRDQQCWIYLLLLRQVPTPHRVRLHLKSGDADTFGETRQQDEFWTKLVRRSVGFSSVTGGCIPWRADGKAAGRPVASRRTLTILRLRLGTTKKNLLPKIVKLGSKPLHTETVLQLTRKFKRIQKRHGTTISTYRRTHRTIWKPSSPWSGKSMENNFAILWQIWRWMWLFGECSWIPLFEQQCIKEKTLTRIYISRRTISGTLWDKYLWESEILGPKTPEIVGLRKNWIWRNYVEIDKLIVDNNYFEELNRIDGMQTEFEWTKFPGFTTLGILQEIQQLMESIQCEPEHFNCRIIFMSMKNDIVWRGNGNTEECIQNSLEVSKYARRFPCGRRSFLGLGSEKKWYRTCSDKPDRNWDRTAEMMTLHLNTESGHPLFRASSAFARENCRSNEHGRKSTQFNDNGGNIEMLLSTVISVAKSLPNSTIMEETSRCFSARWFL